MFTGMMKIGPCDYPPFARKYDATNEGYANWMARMERAKAKAKSVGAVTDEKQFEQLIGEIKQ